MDSSKKPLIVAAALQYMKDHRMSMNEMQAKCNINIAYLSAMLKGEEKLPNGTIIKDSWFEKLADEIGYSLERNIWPHIKTIQFKQIISALTDAKNGDSSSSLRAVLGPAGFCKTDSVTRFREKNPKHTYLVTVSDQMNMSDVVNELLGQLGLPMTGSKHARYVAISVKLRNIKNEGGSPLLIIDEAENSKRPLLRMLKSLYDGINKHCVIVLIGTDQLEDRLLRDVKKNVLGMPQFHSRLKSGITYLSTEKEFELFFDKLNVDRELRKYLSQQCDSYRELSQYLAPALNEAEKQNEPLTLKTFKKFMGIAA